MKHSVPHDVGVALARKTTEKALLSYRDKYPQASVDLSWIDENSAQLKIGIKGMELKGKLFISDRTIDMDFNVPLLMRPFQNKAVAVIDREVTAWLQKAKNGEIA